MEKLSKSQRSLSLYRQYRGASRSTWNLKFNVPNEIPVVFHNSSNYDYHFTIKELSNEFERQFECPGKTKYKKSTRFFSFQ